MLCTNLALPIRQAFYLLADFDLRLGNYRDTIVLVEPAYEAHPDDSDSWRRPEHSDTSILDVRTDVDVSV
jgi:hypothetical protein